MMTAGKSVTGKMRSQSGRDCLATCICYCRYDGMAKGRRRPRSHAREVEWKPREGTKGWEKEGREGLPHHPAVV